MTINSLILLLLGNRVIEAFRLGERGHPTPAPEWFGSPHPSSITDEGILIPTPEGDVLARWGDWIIRGDGDRLPALTSPQFKRVDA